MTTPGERRRNLIWGRALEELSCDAGLQAKWRGEAGSCSGFTSTDFLSRCDAGDLVQVQALVDVLSPRAIAAQGVRAGENLLS